MVQRTVNRLSVNRCRPSTGCSAKRASIDVSTVRSSDDDNCSMRSSSQNASLTCSCGSIHSYDDSLILDADQVEVIRQAIETVNQSTGALCESARQKLAQHDVVASVSTSQAAGSTSSEQHAKRMLPVVPGSAVDGSYAAEVRCHSARSPDRQVSTLSKHMSLIGFRYPRSNEI
jgi:hypothetical protein